MVKRSLNLEQLEQQTSKLRIPNSEFRTRSGANPLGQTLNTVLNSCIQIKSTKINRTSAVPHQICFRLNKQLLEQIAHIQDHQTKLALSPTNLANLRHYALLNLSPGQQSPFTQSGLTFTTEYSFEEDQDSVSLIKSVIGLEGKISQQIQQDLAANPTLLHQISQAHCWLIAEILEQLPLKAKAWYSWIVVSCLAIAIILINISVWYLIPLNYLPKLLVCLSIFLLLSLVAKTLITKQLKPWIIDHLLQGILAKNIMGRKLGLNFLSFLL
jgi:hypothetical protein